MWVLIIVVVIIVYFKYFYNKPQKKASRQNMRSNTTLKKDFKPTKPSPDWTFEREIDQPGVPHTINTYRKAINGYDYKKIVRHLKVISKLIDPIQKNLGYLQFIEPLVELEKNGQFEFNADMPNISLDYLLYDMFNCFNEVYPVIGARGQMENLNDICKFIPELNGWEKNIAFVELELRDRILKSINENGFIYSKDIDKIDGFSNYNLNKNLVYRLLNYGIIEISKEGRYNIYKLKSKD